MTSNRRKTRSATSSASASNRTDPPAPPVSMRVVRYELRSAAELDSLSRAPLPLGIHAAQPRASSHRDLYLDTPDDALRARGVVCRLRVGQRLPHRLTLVLGGDASSERVEATVRESTPEAALAADTAVRRRLLSMI